MAPEKLTKKADGRWVRDIGWKSDGKGGFMQHRFYLGRCDRADACIRALQLVRAWDCVERRTPPGTKPVWDDLTLQIGQALARGEAVVRVLPPQETRERAEKSGLAPEMIQVNSAGVWLDRLQKEFPFVRLELADPFLAGKVAAKEAWVREVEERQADRERQLAADVGHFAGSPSGQTLHQALDGYAEWIRRNKLAPGGKGLLSQHGVTMLTYVKLLKEHHEDRPLDLFGLSEIEAMLSYWKHRPMGKRGRPVAVDTAKDMIKRIKDFVRWLHKSRPRFRWQKPADLEFGPVRVAMTHEEKATRLSSTQVDTYTLDELCKLYEYANPWERLLMLLCLNCGFGQAEVGTLLVSEVKLRQRHEHYRREGSFIKRLRNKTDVYGEWSLWPATVQGIEWQLARRGDTEQQALLLTETGLPLSTPTKGNNRNSKIPQAWARLLERIRKDVPEFRALSFNKLRKTAADLVKRFSDGETAAVFLAHGDPVKSDTLLELYTNRRHDKVFTALDGVAAYLTPMFAAKSVPFPPADAPEERPALSLGKIKRIQALRVQGFKLRKIGELVGVPPETARRYCKGLPASPSSTPTPAPSTGPRWT